MRKALVALALIVASLALVACGGGDSSSSSTTEKAGGAAESSGETEASGESEGGGKSIEEGEAEAEGGTAGSGAQVDFEANAGGDLAFEEKSATANAGKDTIDFTNPASIPHNVSIEDSDGKTIAETETVSEDNTSTSVDLKPGTYTFYCSIPGHREGGMEGTLTVE